MRPVPPCLSGRPFTRKEALAAGASSRMLEGSRFVRVFGNVWRLRDHQMSACDWRTAATLTLPDDAHMTGITRIQALGLDYGPVFPLRFVREGDLHRAIDGIFLHRTKKLAPLDEVGVTPAAAYLAYCHGARTIDAIKVGDWLLHHEHTSKEELEALALSGLWRDGAYEVLHVLEHLDGRSRSLKESEGRVVLGFAGIPPSRINAPLRLSEEMSLIGDMVYDDEEALVEYEGGHHQSDREQYCSDIDRYAILRTEGIPYVQATKEKLAHPRTFVGEVYRMLVRRGYAGDPPVFGDRWRSLFAPLSSLVGDPDAGLRARRAMS